MENEKNKNVLDTAESIKKADKTKMKEDNKHTVADGKGLLAKNEFKNKKSSWFDNSLTTSIMAIITISGFTALIYENLIIPKRNYDDK